MPEHSVVPVFTAQLADRRRYAIRTVMVHRNPYPDHPAAGVLHASSLRPAAGGVSSGFAPWTDYRGVALMRHTSGAYTYSTDHVTLDADGSLFAYHPDNTGRDDLGFASWPSGDEDWRWILVADPHEPERPYVQTDGPAKGYFLSMTTLRDPAGRPTDPASYVDSEAIPYIVFPANFLTIEGVGGFGDLAVARNLATGRGSWAIVADQGPAKHPLGEISLCLAENVGGVNVDPRNGDGIAPGAMQYVIFPNSRLEPAWPQPPAALEAAALGLLAQVGGWPDPSLARPG